MDITFDFGLCPWLNFMTLPWIMDKVNIVTFLCDTSI